MSLKYIEHIWNMIAGVDEEVPEVIWQSFGGTSEKRLGSTDLGPAFPNTAVCVLLIKWAIELMLGDGLTAFMQREHSPIMQDT